MRPGGLGLALVGGGHPLAIVVPCHRELRADGGLDGYVGGVQRRRELLRLEHEFDLA